MTLRTTLVAAPLLAVALSAATPAQAQTSLFVPNLTINIQPTWKCRRGDGVTCSTTEMANPAYRQIVVLSTGYQETERAQFWADFDVLVARMANTGTVWSTMKRDKILYVGYFVGGGAVNTATASFNGAVATGLGGKPTLDVSLPAVTAKIAELTANALPSLKPMAVDVLFNDAQAGVATHAIEPKLLGKAYGVAKMNRDHLQSGYIPTHELAHAALSFADEYVEAGLEDMNIRSFDVATPLALFDGSWSGSVRAISDLFGVYDYNMSEILAGNGNGNISLSAWPSTVYSPISAPQNFAYEGGLGFGRGVFHQAGNNLMNGNLVMRAADDGFAYAHTPNQTLTINTAFGDAAYRANDRLRAAGPKDGWRLEMGSTTTVMLYDGDKNNPVQPTTEYVVQVGWWERQWKTCWATFVPYPCYDDVWTTAQKSLRPTRRSIDLKATSLYGLANLAQSTLCGVGVTEIAKSDGTPFKLCTQPLSGIASAFLPTFKLLTPYEEVQVPASQWFTTYWWRFATHNGTTYSGWTGWSSFYRSY